MNREIRRVSLVVTAMFLALLVASSLIQYGAAGELRDDARNRRTFYDSFDRDRGPITAANGDVLARSEKVDDNYSYQRIYANGQLYAPVTGYTTITAAVTASGLESVENSVLQGTADSLFWTRVQDIFMGKKPTGGAVELTVVPSVQQAAWDALGESRGAAVAFDAKTGEILALVSKPTFDPNALAAHDPEAVAATYAALEADPAHPLYNRAISGDLYAPGSTFKLITAAAALESGLFQADSQLEAPDALELPNSSKKLTNFGESSCSSSGKMTLAEAMTVSCNTAFGWLGMEVGADAIAAQAEKFGFGQNLSIPLRVQPSTFPTNLDRAQTALSAIGQYNDRVTPLQMAMTVAAIANGGRLMTPHLVRSEQDAELRVVEETAVAELSRPISAGTAATLKEMMVAVAEDGTGRRARVDGVTVGAKTGTAETSENAPPDVWTVAFGEAQGRIVAVAVVVEDGGPRGLDGTGGTVAAPMAASILGAVFG
ncbi:MAG: penicillin-binding protein 2 [Bifidobacteriaceae bacterium]|jgi:peptidoglycan glycosyltransferase|nr:penicillin-binding protein 2 [Bifidobacteriaceae bacterium]